MLRFVFVLSVIVANVFAIESNFYREESCSKASGYCVLESECPHAVAKSYKSLCPGQLKDGAVCCKDFPMAQANCYQLHNACFDTESCPSSLRLGPKGCPAGKTCCVLI